MKGFKRVKVADKYYASGYGRGVNTRNVYLINERYYAYHPKYARQSFKPLTGALTGYIECKQLQSGDYYAVN
jgi:hypothetical protein